MLHIANAFYFLSLAIWVGGLVAITFVIIPITLKSKLPHTDINSTICKIRRIFNIVELGCAIILVASTIVIIKFTIKKCTICEITHVIFIGVMVISLIIYSTIINPKLVIINHYISSFGNKEEAKKSAQKYFDKLYKISELLIAMNILIGMVLLVLSAQKIN